MTAADSVRLRRYLLGDATDAEMAATEERYFEDERALDALMAEEERLIEDYLAGQLAPGERRRFEQSYLASPEHRRRVETIRALTAAASAAASASAARPTRFLYLGLAAAAAILLAAGLWMNEARTGNEETAAVTPPSTGERAAAPAPRPPAAPTPEPVPPPRATLPRVFAVAISPVAVRSADDAGGDILLPPAIDVVAVELQGDPPGRPGGEVRVIVRTVTGEEVWRGPARIPDPPAAGVAARAEIPAARLPADDYVVSLRTGSGAAGDAEAYRYFVRVRER